MDLPDIQFSGPASIVTMLPTGRKSGSEAEVLRVVRFRHDDDLGSVLYGEWIPPREFVKRWANRRRTLILRLDYPDGERCDVRLLRTVEWIAESGSRVGGSIFLDLPEVGVRGWAEVLEILPCEPVEIGPGELVTGTFHHNRAWVYDLRIENEPKPIGVTSRHPFWSVDRNDWVPASELREGERLQALDGSTPRVLSLKMRDQQEPVYNIEVDGEHVYRVGEQGLLVHNASAPPNPCPPRTEYDPRPLETVMYQGRPHQRAKGVVAIIVKGTYGRSNFTDSNTPDWYPAFVAANSISGRGWRRGHLLGSQFGGPAEAKNFAPQTFEVNNSVIMTCDNRIDDALACGCVLFEIKVEYGDNNQPLRPTKFIITADNQGGRFLNAEVENVANATTPRSCMR